MFETLSDRLTQVFSSLRGRGRLSPADVEATTREIRIALLEADVALPVVRSFVANVKERALSADVLQALNPASSRFPGPAPATRAAAHGGAGIRWSLPALHLHHPHP